MISGCRRERGNVHCRKEGERKKGAIGRKRERELGTERWGGRGRGRVRERGREK